MKGLEHIGNAIGPTTEVVLANGYETGHWFSYPCLLVGLTFSKFISS